MNKLFRLMAYVGLMISVSEFCKRKQRIKDLEKEIVEKNEFIDVISAHVDITFHAAQRMLADKSVDSADAELAQQDYEATFLAMMESVDELQEMYQELAELEGLQIESEAELLCPE